MTIVLDAGHGGKDVGAKGATQDGVTIHEANIVLDITKRLGKLLEAKYKVIYTRTDNTYLPLKTRANIANKNKANIFVSIHNNAYNGKANGIETFCYRKRGTGGKIATSVQNEMVSRFPDSINRGVKTANYAVLRHTNMPAVLIECEFIDSKPDLLADESKRQRFAHAIFDGLKKSL